MKISRPRTSILQYEYSAGNGFTLKYLCHTKYENFHVYSTFSSSLKGMRRKVETDNRFTQTSISYRIMVKKDPSEASERNGAIDR